MRANDSKFYLSYLNKLEDQYNNTWLCRLKRVLIMTLLEML